jgi:hypothetical protein
MSDCYAGGRMVIRHNTMNSVGVDVHPTGGAGRIRGCRSTEIYGNTFQTTFGNNSPTYTGFWISSGTALVWGNTYTGYESMMEIHSMRRDNSTYPQSATPNGWGYCGTSFDGVGSKWDGNNPASSGYPCLDQPGRGKSDLLINAFPNAINAVTGTTAWPHQNLEPLYEWLNNWSQVSAYPRNKVNNTNSTVFTENQDYYQDASSFTGTSGVGSGLLSARPSTCTPMVAYWATDTSTLYQCSSTNTWTAYYKPFTYPHPLVSGQTSGTSVAPPTNLQVIVQ